MKVYPTFKIAQATYPRYNNIKKPPIFLPASHLLMTNSANKTITDANKNITEFSIPFTSRFTDSPDNSIINIKGKPNPINMSKIFEPTALLIAIPPLPCFDTITDDIKSGTDVPAASIVTAIIASGIFRIAAISTALSTNTQLKPAINTIDIIKMIK